METIELDLNDQEFLELAKQAHQLDITINQHINNILKQVVELNESCYQTAGFIND
jgi:hypothetical protein